MSTAYDSKLSAETLAERKSSKNVQNNLERDLLKDRILSVAISEGIKYGSFSTAFVGGGVAYAHYNIPKFNKIKMTSIKFAIPLMAGLFSFALMTELSMNDMKRNPESFGLLEDLDSYKYQIKNKNSNKFKQQLQLQQQDVVNRSNSGYGTPIHHKFLNFVHQYPFQIIGCTGLPVVGYIFSRQLAIPHLTMSQRVMNTRVFAQGSILVIVMSTMIIKSHVDRVGRFPEF